MDADTPFTAVDRDLLKRCLNREPGSWNDFVDRFLSLIYHTIGYTAHLRSARVGPEDVEDIAAEVLLQIVANNFKVLREFRKQSSLATYLAVVARRICVHELVRRQKVKDAIKRGESRLAEPEPDDAPAAQKGMESLEEVEKLLRRLSGREKEIVRLYYLEGRTYEEISTETDVPVNTIGAVLSRARKKLRETASAGSSAMPDPRTVKVPKAPPIATPKPPKAPKSKSKMEPIPEHRTEASE
ncbi:rna polymerase sigma-e factor-like protein : RNA polymerase sigma factor, sigma-70 family OS=Singulisphaera acidiphila (strain ATCC BAA-1392 / DSM 18658 / VKM B-2454 / MOB10) GN=Sinac_1390 PE=4 SV=1: Sigma70_r4_2 [Gemmata massiliana]|uniref:RNA polymerase sigma factor 70 region 4 type 2 domain-containing protein n=1 Tax=Gemmata massiliana TaxID=1210884 RepID=A0A6P2CQK6_9BACT|nr:sigma-70 family RNA polymerase sigma factor [Gemmata massiliana]VTR91183.1 rna polymerase sigma-e factor-like protein : RNA polymerase sigma factor, sigma-70 family OS=Singulisphaera acidiphila (strain ATCC BAA-1392 / DSM 18658 / VKM B-2454 / MOB10) GN=Sinac_1390 PE=4 SV=1: Sigma70_r4_2 [Gemmata massiliana]